MKQCFALVFAASLLVLAGCCTTPNITKWEYKVASPPRPAIGGLTGGPAERRQRQQALLNELGKDGWVLISQTDGSTFYFRRAIK